MNAMRGQDVVRGGDHGRDAEAPLEAEGEVERHERGTT